MFQQYMSGDQEISSGPSSSSSQQQQQEYIPGTHVLVDESSSYLVLSNGNRVGNDNITNTVDVMLDGDCTDSEVEEDEDQVRRQGLSVSHSDRAKRPKGKSTVEKYRAKQKEFKQWCRTRRVKNRVNSGATLDGELLLRRVVPVISSRLDALDDHARLISSRLDALDDHARVISSRLEALDDHARDSKRDMEIIKQKVSSSEFANRGDDIERQLGGLLMQFFGTIARRASPDVVNAITTILSTERSELVTNGLATHPAPPPPSTTASSASSSTPAPISLPFAEKILGQNGPVQSVRDLWKAWWEGIDDSTPSIMELEETHSNTWRKSAKYDTIFSRHKRIIATILARLHTNESLDNVLSALDLQKGQASFYNLFKNLPKPQDQFLKQAVTRPHGDR